MKPLLVLFATTLLLATAQQPEVIFLDGEELSLYACPLEEYQGWRKPPGFAPISTGNYRGYVGTWRIEDQRLYLTDIQAEVCRTKWPRRCRAASLKELFPTLKVGRVEATWFSGTLHIPRGKLLTYVHMGFGSVYEEEIQLEVVQGRVIKRTVVDQRAKALRDPMELSWEELQKMGARPRD